MVEKKRNLRKLEDELWREVPHSNSRYQVSNYGRVKSFAYNKTEGKMMVGFIINRFRIIQLNINKHAQKYYVHKLVAEHWIPKPSDKHTIVTHLDGNMTNNHVSNLEWHTRESLAEKHREYEKQRDRRFRKRNPASHSKLKEEDVRHLKAMLEKGVVQAKIAKMFCLSEMQVTRIKRGENWGHVQPLNPDSKKSNR